MNNLGNGATLVVLSQDVNAQQHNTRLSSLRGNKGGMEFCLASSPVRSWEGALLFATIETKEGPVRVGMKVESVEPV